MPKNLTAGKAYLVTYNMGTERLRLTRISDTRLKFMDVDGSGVWISIDNIIEMKEV
jgi:hypothetical protein